MTNMVSYRARTMQLLTYTAVIIRDPNLQPTYVVPPAAYAAAEKKKLDHPSTVDDIIDHVALYFEADILGAISTRLLITADYASLRHE